MSARMDKETQITDSAAPIAALPKAELHLHLEGSISPQTAAVLAARHGAALEPEEVEARYSYQDFPGFLEAFKWVTSYLQAPEDYALVVHRLADELLRQNVVYAEVILSVGVMLRRNQNVEANFMAIHEISERIQAKGLQLKWIFDATRQFGASAAMEVADRAARMQPAGVVAFGMGGDELSHPLADFRAVYELARNAGLHAVVHAGEIGGPETIREAVELLGAERIGHGIAAMRDPELIDWLRIRHVALEICPTSNIATGALARQLGRSAARIEEHPLREFFQRGALVTLSTDDPAMFHTDLLFEYSLAASLGFSAQDLTHLAENSFHAAFLPAEEKRALLTSFQERAKALGLV
jgi:aminodeoxyfutalosine deaminase